jgi:hypothetical protein
MISIGVNNRYAGSKDPSTAAGQKYAMAKNALVSAQTSAESYSAARNRLAQNYKGLDKEARALFDYNTWKTTGLLKFKPGVSDAEKTAVYNVLFPGYKPQQTQSITGFSTPTVDEDKFDYSAWAEAIGQAVYASNGTQEPGGGNEETYDPNLAKKLRDLFMGGGSDLKQYFGTNSDQYRVMINGVPHLKLNLSVKTNSKGDNKLADAGITKGAISLYIPEERATGLWQGVNQISTPTGQVMQIPRYGTLSSIPQKLFTTQTAVDWVDRDLTRLSKAKLPDSLLSKYDLDGGYISFAGVDSDAKAMVAIKIDGKTHDSPILIGPGQYLTRGLYANSPSQYSRTIDAAIRIQLEKIKNQRTAKEVSDAALHRANYLQNPGNFVSVDDIQSA